jgi:hypothetical protein
MSKKRTPAKIVPEVKKSSIIPTPGDVGNIAPPDGVDNSKKLEFIKRKLIECGMPADDVDVFTTVEQCEKVLNTMKAKEVIKKVDTLEEKVNPVEERQIEKQWQTKADIMMNKWLGQSTVRFMIPLEPGEKRGIVTWGRDKGGRKVQIAAPGTGVELVQVNGARWLVPKGVICNIPEGVASVLERRLNLTNIAGQEFLVDRMDPETGKPISDSL